MAANTDQKKHLFISYSRADAKFVDQLSSSLANIGIPIWIDIVGLQPGTPNWQKAIREAVSAALAVILVASPESANSEAVQGEIELARAYGIPIIPIWIYGDIWVNCVPLQLISYQYINCRDEEYGEGIKRLIQQISSLILSDAKKHQQHTSAAGINVILSLGRITFLEVNGSLTVQDMLDKLYIRELRGVFSPYRYGADWLLVTESEHIQRIFAPWEWMLNRFRGVSLSKSRVQWEQNSIEHHGIRPGGTWRIVNTKPLMPWMICTNLEYLNALIVDLAHSPQNAQIILDLLVGRGNNLHQLNNAQLQASLAGAAVRFSHPRSTTSADLAYKLLLNNEYKIYDGVMMRIEAKT